MALSRMDVVKEYVAEVAPPMSFQLPPESVETCHLTVGVGRPDAAAVKEACWVAYTVELDG